MASHMMVHGSRRGRRWQRTGFTPVSVVSIVVSILEGGGNEMTANVMAAHINVSPDGEKIQLSILQNGVSLAWIEFSGPQSDEFMKVFSSCRSKLADVLPSKQTHHATT